MKLELKEIQEDNNTIVVNDNFKTFQDILNCFDKQNIFFKSLEKDLIINDFYQVFFIFFVFMFLNFSLSLFAIAIKLSISFFLQKIIKHLKLDFSFSSTIYQILSFSSYKNKQNASKVITYNKEKNKFLIDFFTIPIHKEIIFKFLDTFFKENEYRLSNDVYSEIDKIKQCIEKELYEEAFHKILSFKSRIDYINNLNKFKV